MLQIFDFKSGFEPLWNKKRQQIIDFIYVDRGIALVKVLSKFNTRKKKKYIHTIVLVLNSLNMQDTEGGSIHHNND